MAGPKRRAGAPRKAKVKKTGGGLPQMGGGGAAPDMQNMMGMVEQMRTEMATVQESLTDDELTATVGGGVVTVTVTGDQKVKSVKIDPDAVDPDDVDMLQDLVVAGVNEALRLAKEHGEEKMSAVTGGLDLGGLGDMMG